MNIVIAKNAADREFTFEQSNGQHSMNMNIDIFRSLAEQLHEPEWLSRVKLKMEQALIDRKPQFTERAAGFTGLDLRKEKETTYFRVFSSGSLNHTDASFTLELEAQNAEIEHKQRVRFWKEEDERQRPTQIVELEASEVSRFVQAFESLNICSGELPKQIGLDGTNWVFETTSNNEYCADIYWGGRRPKLLEPLIFEMEKILEAQN